MVHKGIVLGGVDQFVEHLAAVVGVLLQLPQEGALGRTADVVGHREVVPRAGDVELLAVVGQRHYVVVFCRVEVVEAAIRHLVCVLEAAFGVDRDAVDEQRPFGRDLFEPERLAGTAIYGAADGEGVVFATCNEDGHAGYYHQSFHNM